VNESDHDKMVRNLKDENQELKKMIEDLNKKIMNNGGMIKDEDKMVFLDLKEQYDANSKVMVEMAKTFEEKLEEAKKTAESDKEEYLGTKVDITVPHLVVLNEDPQLSHKLKYSLKQPPVYVGRKHGNPPPQIVLSGVGIKINHAKIVQNGGEMKIIPHDAEARDFIFVNGKKLGSNEGQKLKHKDRIIFGTNTIFLYMEKSDGKDILGVDWEFAQQELQKEMEEISEKQKN